MKQIVEQLPTVTLSLLDSVNTDKYYGVERLHKAPVICCDVHLKDVIYFAPHPTSGFSRGNGWSFSSSAKGINNLKDFLQSAINAGWTVYEFDTSIELYKWLSE